MRLLSVQVGLPRRHRGGGDQPGNRSWLSAIVKEPVAGAVHLGRENLAGDRQADRQRHGGLDMAVLCYAAQHYRAWRRELLMPELPYGAFGENFTILGQDEHSVCIGDVYELGGAVIQVSQPRGPCYKIGRRWARPDLLARVEATGRHGWYARVLAEGEVRAGDAIALAARPHPEWSVRRAADAYRLRAQAPGPAAALAGCQALAGKVRDRLRAGADAAAS